MSQQGSYEGSTYEGSTRVLWRVNSISCFLRLSRVLPTFQVFTSGYVNTETILHFFIWQHRQSQKIRFRSNYGKKHKVFTLKEIKLSVHHLDGKRTSSNKVVKETAKIEQQSPSKYLEAVKGFEKGKKIRWGNQKIQTAKKKCKCFVFIWWRHSFFNCFLYSVSIHRSSIYQVATIMLLDYSTFTSFSNSTVILLTLVNGNLTMFTLHYILLGQCSAMVLP